LSFSSWLLKLLSSIRVSNNHSWVSVPPGAYTAKHNIFRAWWGSTGMRRVWGGSEEVLRQVWGRSEVGLRLVWFFSWFRSNRKP
jgi:hypothetical protein